MGGPMGVEDGGRVLMALSHTQVGRAALEVIPGLWLINTFDAVAPEHRDSLVVFVGYCGWGSADYIVPFLLFQYFGSS